MYSSARYYTPCSRIPSHATSGTCTYEDVPERPSLANDDCNVNDPAHVCSVATCAQRARRAQLLRSVLHPRNMRSLVWSALPLGSNASYARAASSVAPLPSTPMLSGAWLVGYAPRARFIRARQRSLSQGMAPCASSTRPSTHGNHFHLLAKTGAGPGSPRLRWHPCS